jgi:mRNA interferase HicA
MKRRDLEQRLRSLGWSFERHGGRHDVWRKGQREESVPRHREIAERLALAILKRAAQEDQ